MCPTSAGGLPRHRSTQDHVGRRDRQPPSEGGETKCEQGSGPPAWLGRWSERDEGRSKGRLRRLVGKVAYDPTIDGHDVHVEGFGIARDFYSRNAGQNRDVVAGGGGVLVGAVPETLEVQLCGGVGAGLGRYGTS